MYVERRFSSFHQFKSKKYPVYEVKESFAHTQHRSKIDKFIIEDSYPWSENIVLFGHKIPTTIFCMFFLLIYPTSLGDVRQLCILLDKIPFGSVL